MPRETKLVEPEIVRRAIGDSFVKLNPRTLMRNPVMFVVGVGAVLTTILFFKDLGSSTTNQNVFTGLVTVFLWFTVLFANFAEAIAEGRGKAQAETLRKTRSETLAHVRRADGTIEDAREHRARRRRRGRGRAPVSSIPERRRGHRGHRQRRRVGDHRRVGTRDPGVRWRPLRGDRRHPRALGPDRGADHRSARVRRSSTG